MGGKSKSKHVLGQLYDAIMKIFVGSDFDFVLFHGSLLGYVREGDFIEGDDDIDVLMSRKKRSDLIRFIKENRIKTGLVLSDIIQLYYEDIGPFDIYLYDELEDDILLKWDGNLLYKKN